MSRRASHFCLQRSQFIGWLLFKLKPPPRFQRGHPRRSVGAGYEDSSRDYAARLMEAVRHWGFGARFVAVKVLPV